MEDAVDCPIVGPAAPCLKTAGHTECTTSGMAASLRTTRQASVTRRSITDLPTEVIGDNLIANRTDGANHLSELGVITRQGGCLEQDRQFD